LSFAPQERLINFIRVDIDSLNISLLTIWLVEFVNLMMKQATKTGATPELSMASGRKEATAIAKKVK